MAGSDEEVSHAETLIDGLRRELKRAVEEMCELARHVGEMARHVKDLETSMAQHQSTIVAHEHHINMLLESNELERAEAARRERVRSLHEGERRLAPVPGVTPGYPPAR